MKKSNVIVSILQKQRGLHTLLSYANQNLAFQMIPSELCSCQWPSLRRPAHLNSHRLQKQCCLRLIFPRLFIYTDKKLNFIFWLKIWKISLNFSQQQNIIQNKSRKYFNSLQYDHNNINFITLVCARIRLIYSPTKSNTR